jgi:transcriptional regulator with XRE-family HTH domain
MPGTNMHPSGSLLRAARRARGLSQEKLAREADCTTKTIYLMENGYAPESSPTRDRIEAILFPKTKAQRAGWASVKTPVTDGRHGSAS